MHILHISNSYGGTKVYENLYTQLDQLGIKQTIFVPLNFKNRDRVGNQMIDFQVRGSQIIYSTILKRRHKYLYMAKIQSITNAIEKAINIHEIDAIHASTLCLDGAVAYSLSKKHDIPYIVAIRNTDVNNYYKLLFWHRGFFGKILKSAKNIVFISPKYKDTFLSKIISSALSREISERIFVIPNGISDMFLENKSHEHKSFSGTLNLIFVAAFYKGKGLVETINAIEVLRSKGYNITLNAIGKGLPNRPHDMDYEVKIEKLATGKNWIRIQPFLSQSEIILEMAKANAFIMVSKPETFGLVYVEALSQHLPIIYSQDQGFDGYYPDGYVGYAAQAGDVYNIAEKIECLINNYTAIAKNVETLNLDDDFSWCNIGKKYSSIYNSLL